MNIEELKAKALAATACNLDTAQIVRNNPDDEFDCPVCNCEGYVSGVVDYCNIDSLAVGVMFYGIGKEHGADEEYFRAANPAAILELISELEAVKAERDELKNLHDAEIALAESRQETIYSLRARIEAAQKQEPYAEWKSGTLVSDHPSV